MEEFESPARRSPTSSASSFLAIDADEVVDERMRDRRRAMARLRTAIARAGTLGCVIRGGLSVGKVALRASRGRRVGASEARRAVGDALEYGVFLAAFAGTYVGMDELVRVGLGARRTRAWRCAAAGACAGTSLILVGGRGASHYGLAGYVWVRSLVLLARVAQKSEDEGMRRATRITRWEHGDVALMTGSAAVILSCFILKPELVEPAYRHFLNVHGGKSLEEYAALRELCEADGNVATRTLCEKMVASTTWSAGTSARDVANKTAVSAIATETGPIDRSELYRLLFFRGASNAEHFAAHVAKSFAATLSVYLPVYLVPALVVHREKLFSLKRGPDLLTRIAKGSARSALFLSSYVGAAWSGVDLANRALGRTCDTRSLTLGVSMAGLATLIEKKSRRMELAMYCVSRALETAALMVVYKGLVPEFIQRQRCDILLFSVASATIMHCYNTERDVFRSKYLNVLDYIFGCTGHESHSISHVGSYEILFAPERKPTIVAATPPTPKEMVDFSNRTTYATEEEFFDASKAIQESLSEATVDDILRLYGLYKQSVAGDARTTPRPSALDEKALAKYEAWERYEGTSRRAAMTGYVALVASLTERANRLDAASSL